MLCGRFGGGSAGCGRCGAVVLHSRGGCSEGSGRLLPGHCIEQRHTRAHLEAARKARSARHHAADRVDALAHADETIAGRVPVERGRGAATVVIDRDRQRAVAPPLGYLHMHVASGVFADVRERLLHHMVQRLARGGESPSGCGVPLTVRVSRMAEFTERAWLISASMSW